MRMKKLLGITAICAVAGLSFTLLHAKADTFHHFGTYHESCYDENCQQQAHQHHLDNANRQKTTVSASTKKPLNLQVTKKATAPQSKQANTTAVKVTPVEKKAAKTNNASVNTERKTVNTTKQTAPLASIECPQSTACPHPEDCPYPHTASKQDTNTQKDTTYQQPCPNYDTCEHAQRQHHNGQQHRYRHHNHH